MTSDVYKGENSCPASGYENVVLSMKDLHLQRPVFTKPRKVCPIKKRTSSNTLNIAVAASGFQRPIVWPARLANHTERISSHILRPSRFRLAKKDAVDRETKSTKATFLSKVALNSETSEGQQDCVFGSVSRVDYSSLSFSRLNRQATQSPEKSNVEGFGSCSTASHHETADDALTRYKHQSNVDAVSAKFAMAPMEDGETGTCQRVFSDYRSPGCAFSYRPSELSGTVQSSRQEVKIPPAPSGLETLASLQSALAVPSQAVSQGFPESIRRSGSQDVVQEEANVNELASYFEDLLHIPRKMSSMAEMMYA